MESLVLFVCLFVFAVLQHFERVLLLLVKLCCAVQDKVNSTRCVPAGSFVVPYEMEGHTLLLLPAFCILFSQER